MCLFRGLRDSHAQDDARTHLDSQFPPEPNGYRDESTGGKIPIERRRNLYAPIIMVRGAKVDEHPNQDFVRQGQLPETQILYDQQIPLRKTLAEALKILVGRQVQRT